jgi:hypothetical protein
MMTNFSTGYKTTERLARYHALSNELALLSNQRLSDLLEKSDQTSAKKT